MTLCFGFWIFFFFFKARNGDALPPDPLARTQRAPQTPSKEAAGGGEREEAEQKALLAVQCSLLKILSKTLATLQHFTPDCCQILLDQVSLLILLLFLRNERGRFSFLSIGVSREPAPHVPVFVSLHESDVMCSPRASEYGPGRVPDPVCAQLHDAGL